MCVEGSVVAIVFRSKIDSKFKAFALALAGVALFTTWTRPKEAPAAVWTAMDLLMIGAAAFAIWITFTTYYELEHDALVAHSGPFSWRIPLAEIIAVRPSDSSQSSPAMSMDRLEIRYGSGRSLLISPADQAGFLAMLHHRVPRLAGEQQR
jgi:Bacterial PH domain